MERLSDRLRNYDGTNPFRESQARMYASAKLAEEFYPTSFFWSLFNDEHEILLGTRGSGKTALLRMLTYSCLRRLGHERARSYAEARTFVGFYVPMHLEFMASLPGHDAPLEQRMPYFQFAFNCAAAKSLLDEVEQVLADTSPTIRTALSPRGRYWSY